MKTYQIILNEEQLNLIADCIEDCSRFASGQWEMHYTVEEMVRFAAPKDFKKQIEKRDEAEHHLKNARNAIISLPENASYGYDTTDFIGNTYQIYRTIRYIQNKDNNNVYSSPALPSGNLGTIEIKEI